MADTVDITNVTALHLKAERRTRSKPDRTNSERQKRFREKRRARQLPAVTPEGSVTSPPIEKAPACRNAIDTATAPRKADTVTRGAVTAKRDGVTVAHPSGRVAHVMAYVVAVGLATVGVGLSVVGMVETTTYALAVGGVMFCALAVAADVLTLTMPSVVGALWRGPGRGAVVRRCRCHGRQPRRLRRRAC